MKRKKLTIIVLIMSLVFSLGMLGNVIIMNTHEKLSEANTTEFTATVRNVGVDGEGTNEYCIVYSEEYGDKLSTFNIKEISDINDFTSLKRGQIVFFRTKNIWIEQLEEMKVIPILSIRTEEKDIISLDRYNEYLAPLFSSATIAGIIVALIFLLVSIHCVLLLKGINVFHRGTR